MSPSLVLRTSRLASIGLQQTPRLSWTSIIRISPNSLPTRTLRHQSASSHPFIRPTIGITVMMSSSSSNPQPRFSPGSDPAAMEAALAPLLTSNGGQWILGADGEALERTFKFKTFAKTWDFMTAVSLQCKLKNHHPEWSNVFNTTFIRWTTHQPKSLSAKDVELAAVCDALARDFGEVVVEGVAAVEKEQAQARQSADHQPSSQGQAQGGSQACDMSGLAGRAASSAGDCCVPRKK